MRGGEQRLRTRALQRAAVVAVMLAAALVIVFSILVVGEPSVAGIEAAFGPDASLGALDPVTAAAAARMVTNTGLGAAGLTGDAGAPSCVVGSFLDGGGYTHCLNAYEMTPGPASELATGQLIAISDWTPLGISTSDPAICWNAANVTIGGCDAGADAGCLFLTASAGDAATPCPPQWDAGASYDAGYFNQAVNGGFFQETPGVNRSPPFAIEVHYKHPAGNGIWPIATNTYPVECQSPNVNTAMGRGGGCVFNNENYAEFDSCEQQGGTAAYDFAEHSAHCDQNPAATIIYTSNGGTGYHTVVTILDYDGATGIGSVVWYLDGALVGSISSGTGGPQPDGSTVLGCGATGFLPPIAQFLGWSLSMGSNGGHYDPIADLPRTSVVDYIRIACHWDGTKCIR